MKRIVPVMVLTSIMLLGPAAMADVIPPEVAACEGLDAGNTCNGGVCQKSTCSRLDYSQGSPPVGTIAYDCVKCGSSPNGQGGTSGGSGGSAGGKAGQSGGSAGGKEGKTTVTGGSSGGKHTSSNCSFSRVGHGGDAPLGPWLAGAVAILFLGRRRRTR
jgi:MYXO-CTERM domain-containing protein